jgi:signal transduction histidine kinase
VEIERARAEEKQKQAEKLSQQARELARTLEELQKKNQEIVSTQQQLIMQEKLASLGQLTAGIAHEIKNPLNFIVNFAEGSHEMAGELTEILLHNRPSLPTEQFKQLEELVADLRANVLDIEKSGRKIDRIVRSMMDHARGTDIGWQPFNLNELLDENAVLAFHSYRATDSSFNVDFQKAYDPSLPMIKALPQPLGRVFLNVLNNACYAVNEKQKRIKNSYQPVIRLITRELDDCVEIRIRDNGPGIPPEIRKEIFTPFFTTKPTGIGNTGLGLSISYDIVVKEHEGKLEVDSEPGKFTEFRIVLPKDGERGVDG